MANWTTGVFLQRYLVPLHRQTIEQDKTSGETGTNTGYQLQCFYRLNAADHSDYWPEDTCLGTGICGFVAFLVQASITRCIHLARIDNTDLSIKPNGSASDQRHLMLDADSVDGKTCGKIIAAIEYHCAIGYQFFKVVAFESVVDCLDGDLRVDRMAGFTGRMVFSSPTRASL